MKNFIILFVSCVLGIVCGVGVVYLTKSQTKEIGVVPLENVVDSPAGKMIQARGMSEEELREIIRRHVYRNETVSGHYLTGRFAQRHHDWTTASAKLSNVMEKTGIEDLGLLKRSMVLAMGAGEYERTFEAAARVQTLIKEQPEEDPSALATLFLGIQNFKNKDYDKAVSAIRDMPPGSLSNFVMPLLYGWSAAAMGEYDIADLDKTATHIYHAIMISDFLGQHDQIEGLLDKALQAPGLSIEDTQRIADIYAHIGKTEQALDLYNGLVEIQPSAQVEAKIESIKAGTPQKIFEAVKTPEAGIARALYDMARVLAYEYSDESARVFAHMGLYLDPDLTDAKFLLAGLSARNGHENEAISAYQSIEKENSHERYVDAQRMAADLMEEQGRDEDAIKTLEALYESDDDLEALIQIGDIHRRAENYKEALKYYNRAAKDLGDIPAEYWHLHYARGMAYEQDGQWKKAEQELKTALAFQPENPYVLNYLGYAWADQGLHLDKALKFIDKAVELRPMDGYITDSLGWVLYRLGEFEKAVPHLEKAVELRPYDPVINDHLGDAYWRVGRKLEAKFQWKRAQNHAEEEALIQKIEVKLVDGLAPLAKHPDDEIRAAQADSTSESPAESQE